MPAVLIHGVPDTIRVWDLLKEHLIRTDVVTLALPGFGAPLPNGFTATKEEYVTWIVEQLEGYGEPVDLVGHDWGGILTTRVAALRPDLIRTWAASSGPVSGGYEWHQLAKVWQTPDAGEKWMQELNPDELSAFMAKSGYPLSEAKAAVSRIDASMRDSILKLYRSAVNVGPEWQPDLDRITSPGLVLWGENDTACPIRFADELALDAHAQRLVKLDCDHWTIVERSAEIAAALEQHWAMSPLNTV